MMHLSYSYGTLRNQDLFNITTQPEKMGEHDWVLIKAGGKRWCVRSNCEQFIGKLGSFSVSSRDGNLTKLASLNSECVCWNKKKKFNESKNKISC